MANLGLEDDVRVSSVELALIALLSWRLLDNLQLLNAPDLDADFLASAFEAVVEDSGHSGGGLEFCVA